MKLPSWTYLAVLAIGIFICWYFMRGCDKPDEGLVDSIKVLAAKNDSLVVGGEKVKHQNDSLKIAIKEGDSIYKHKLDSQSRIIAIWQGRFKVTKDSIGVLYGNLKKFYLNHDTIALAETYNRLAQELQDANQQLFAIQIARDSSDNIRDAEIARQRRNISELEDQIDELSRLLTACTNNASELAKTGAKAAKKAKISALISKIGIGISAVLALILISHN